MKECETSLEESLQVNAKLLDVLETKLAGLQDVTDAQRARVSQIAASLHAVRNSQQPPEGEGDLTV